MKVKMLRKLKTYRAELGVAANWRKADGLDFAWFLYGSPESQQRYRQSSNELATETLKFEMCCDLRDRLGDGELLALGIPIDATSNRDPIVIPATFFVADSVAIMSGENSIVGLGKRFSDVRIIGAEEAITEKECVAADEVIATPPLTEQPHALAVAPAKRGGGRSNLYSRAKPILAELFRNPTFEAMAAGPLLETFNEAFVSRYSTDKRKAAGVSERSLRTYLTQYRQELANTGSNESAN